MKLTNEEKVKIAKEHLDEGVTLHELAKKHDINVAHIKYFIALYRLHGEDVFLKREWTTIYEREFKLKAIQRYINGKESYRKIALELGFIDPGILRDWVDSYKAKGEAAIQTTRARANYLRHEDRLDKIAEKSLKERLEYLEAENEYLKKSYSLILKRSKRSKKK